MSENQPETPSKKPPKMEWEGEEKEGEIMRPPTHICLNCETPCCPDYEKPGYLFIEVILWCVLLPGMWYTHWRVVSAKPVCPLCRGDTVPIDSPRGKRLMCGKESPRSEA